MKARAFFRGTVSAVLIILISLGVLYGTLGNVSHKSYAAALILAFLFSILVFTIIKKDSKLLHCLDRFSPVAVCVLLSLLCLIINGMWVLVFQPEQAPDYQTFFKAASDLASRTPLSGKDYLAMFPHILGYASFLSIFLRAFGISTQVAAIINVVLTTGTGILLYLLSLRWIGGRTAAAFVLLLWIICPSKLLYNTMTLSEPYYTFLLMLFVLLASAVFDQNSAKVKEQNRVKEHKPEAPASLTVLIGALCGVILALVNTARPVGVIPIIAFLIWSIFLTDRKQQKTNNKSMGIYVLVLLVVYFATGRVWNTYAANLLDQEPPSVPGYSIYVGFNLDTQGAYADEDMELLQSRYFGEYDRNARLTQQSMLQSAKERIEAAKKSVPNLMLHKLGILLGHDEGGAFYSGESLSGGEYKIWCVLSNIWYYFICIFAVVGSYDLLKYKRKDCIWLAPLCIIGIILAQLLVEVAARYHYCIIPLLLLLSASVLHRQVEIKTK